MKNKRTLSLYVHIPFCVKKCNYCDFLSFSSGEEEKEQYIEALCQEIESFFIINHHKIKELYEVTTIFFGGGTPSILKAEQIKRIMDSIQKTFLIADGAEITIEMNPGSVTKEKLEVYKAIGINRLSIGLQTTDNQRLKRLGRVHTYEQFLENYHCARKLGFKNISVDLMSALPNENLDQYQLDLKRILDLKPEHISSYSLILEEGTPFYEDKQLQEELPEEDEERKMYEITAKMLEEEGYFRYEISNYAKKGKESRHNSVYWTGGEYLGLGLGASSYLWKDSPFLKSISHSLDFKELYGVRFANTDQLTDYINNPTICCEKRSQFTKISRNDAIEEFMFLGLRMCEGISTEQFYQKFGERLENIYQKVLERFIPMGLLEWKENGQECKLALTERGIDVSNTIFAEFLLE